MIQPLFQKKFNLETFTDFVISFVAGFEIEKSREQELRGFKKVQQIGISKKLDLVVFAVQNNSGVQARVEITKQAYAILKSHGMSHALVAFYSYDTSEWRLSLITTSVKLTPKGVKEESSNPRRFSYVLGPEAKIMTPSIRLVGTVDTLKDLKDKFSLEVVNKDFYSDISVIFTKLVGGTRKSIQYPRTLKASGLSDEASANFAIRLIGRLVFCWFLKQKKSASGIPLIPNELLSSESLSTYLDYYHTICAPLFFEILNKPSDKRSKNLIHKNQFDSVPFLNGGLFNPHEEDNYKYDSESGTSNRGIVAVPDQWFKDFFIILEKYNFTIDENTLIDTELSVDPEMLGRIFENLLAEVNPETGESARKSTGSFYTPREIVDYMVDESIIAHLVTKTSISESKIRALSSYGIEDDKVNPLNDSERLKIVKELHHTTVLDPACGSGAFPIGVLQKIVYMLGQTDPKCDLYLKIQLEKAGPELRRHIQEQFNNDNLNYIRKLGVIRECIHGIDIQPIATDISRLRCFLTLMVDQRVNDTAKNRGIEPLPNLDFKFMCANSLIKPATTETGGMFNDEFVDALSGLVDQYFSPVDQLEKLTISRDLERLISDKTKKELEIIISDTGIIKEEKYVKAYKKLKESDTEERMRTIEMWDSYKNIFLNKRVEFFDTKYFFPAVYKNGGFDIVIANPPYVDSETMTKSGGDIRTIYKNLYASARGNWDLFVVFIEKGFQLLKKDGIISYIVPNKLIGASYTKELKKFLLSKNIKELRDYSRVDVFKEVSVYPVVFVAKNNNDRQNILLTSMKSETEVKSRTKIKPELFYKDIYWDKYFLPNDQLNIILKLSSVINLSSVANKITDAATVSEAYEIKKYLQVSHSENDTNFKKFINTGTIDPYVSLWGKNKTQYIKQAYIKPVILDYNLKSVSENRFKQACADKIIIAGMSKRLECFYDEGQYLAGKSTIVILEDEGNLVSLKYLFALMNSRLLSFWYTNYFSSLKMAGGFLNVSSKELGLLPIKELHSEKEKPFIEIVNKILAITKSSDYLENSAKKEEVKEYEKQIDQLVYKLYGLDSEEIKIIEK